MTTPPLSRPAPEVALVTGGAGFVGTYLIQRLVDEFPDTRVISVDNYFTGSVENHVGVRPLISSSGLNAVEIIQKTGKTRTTSSAIATRFHTVRRRRRRRPLT